MNLSSPSHHHTIVYRVNMYPCMVAYTHHMLVLPAYVELNPNFSEDTMVILNALSANRRGIGAIKMMIGNLS